MKFIIIAAILALSQCVFLPQMKNGNAFAEIQQVNSNYSNFLTKMDTTPFGKKLIDTIALQLKSNAPLEDVSMLLDNLLHNVVKQQQEQDDMHDEQQISCKKELEEYTHRQDIARENIRDSAYNVKKLHVQLKHNEDSIEQKEYQIAILKERQERLEHQQEVDQVNYNKRKEELDTILEALDTIMPKLQQAVSGQGKDAVFAELAKIGKKNPIAALVAVASSMTTDEKESVMVKLSELKESLVSSYQDNEQLHQDTTLKYVNQKGELEMLIDDLSNEHESLKQTKVENEAKLEFEMKRRDESTEELEDAQHGLDMKGRQCTEWNEIYKRETEQRALELETIRRIIEIVSTKLNVMNSYLVQRS